HQNDLSGKFARFAGFWRVPCDSGVGDHQIHGQGRIAGNQPAFHILRICNVAVMSFDSTTTTATGIRDSFKLLSIAIVKRQSDSGFSIESGQRGAETATRAGDGDMFEYATHGWLC